MKEETSLVMEETLKEFYMELKSVKPNKNEMRAAKQDLLNVLAMRQKVRDTKDVYVYLALPFNPYFSGQYRRWTVTTFFKAGEGLLVGKEFWDFVARYSAWDLLTTHDEYILRK